MLRRERRSSVGGETEYAFRHVLMRDVAYGQIPRAQRADKHRRAAEWIESLSADRENAPDMLAHHYSQALEYARDAGQPTEELERRTRLALRDAAERAAALNSFTPAQRHYVAALALWPEDDPDWPELIVVAADRRSVWRSRRGHDRGRWTGPATGSPPPATWQRRQGGDARRVPLLERGDEPRSRSPRFARVAQTARAAPSLTPPSRVSRAGSRSTRCCGGSSTRRSRSASARSRSPTISASTISAATC